MREKLLLDGQSLSIERLAGISRGGIDLDLTPEAWAQVQRGRSIGDDCLTSGKPFYGINTGVGSRKIAAG